MSAFREPSHSASAFGNRNGRIRERHTAAALGLLGLLALSALVMPPRASAAPTAIQAYGYSHTLASEGQMEPPFNEVLNGIGVDPETGDVIVAEPSALRLGVYAPDAGPADPPITSFGDGHYRPRLAVAPNGDVYAADNDHGLVRFKRNPGSPPTYALDTSYTPEVPRLAETPGLAIDPSTGDVLIASPGDGEVVRFDASGARVSSFLTQSGQSNPSAIAVTANGTIFVVDHLGGGAALALYRFSAGGQQLSRRLLPMIQGIPPTVNLAYDPLHDGVDLLVAGAGAPARVEGLNSEGKQLFTIPFPESTAGARNLGLALDPDAGRLFALTGGPNGVQVFEPATYPGVEPPVVTAITPSSAHVGTEVDPGSPLPSESFARFEYSLDEGIIKWTPSPDQDDASQSRIEADLIGLLPNRHYLIRAAAGNKSITHFSEPVSVTTAPVVPVTVTDPPTGITETGAVLNGSINPVGLQTTYRFEYGTTEAYGGRVPVGIDAIAGGTHLTRSFSRTLTGLQPGTTYHYRLVANNSVGESPGADRTFTTLAAGSVPARTFEQVTPVDKNGASIIGGTGFLASSVGSQVAYLETSPGRSLSSPLEAVSISRRGSTDWGTTSVDPPLNVAQGIAEQTTLGVSADLSHALVGSNRALALGAIENGCNLYIADVANQTYELVASTEILGACSLFTSPSQFNKFVGGTADFSAVIFISPAPLLPGAPEWALYRWSGSGGLELESRLPGDAIPPTAHVAPPSVSGAVRMSSDDASRVYFTLSGGPEAGIYLREGGVTRAISVSHRAGDDPTAPRAGIFLGASRDGRYAFFAATSAQLTEDAPSAENNVYRYDADTDALEFLGTQLSSTPSLQENNLGVSDDGSTIYLAPNQVWRNGNLRSIPGPSGEKQGDAFISSDGRYLAYWELNPEPKTPTDRYLETVYLYDAVKETTTCVSCLAGGSDPGGATLPAGVRQISYQPASPFDEQGDLFFTSKANLVAADGNGSNDVYEYSDGKLRLITPGTQPFGAVFGAVSAEGRDVYFTTAQGLVSRDLDREVDVYDARIDGGLAAQNLPRSQECLRDDCKAVPNSASEPRIGGSEALQGPANVKPKTLVHACPKGKRSVKRKGKKACVKVHPKKVKTHSKKANHHRRQGR